LNQLLNSSYLSEFGISFLPTYTYNSYCFSVGGSNDPSWNYFKKIIKKNDNNSPYRGNSEPLSPPKQKKNPIKFTFVNKNPQRKGIDETTKRCAEIRDFFFKKRAT
jgi:hypothetical protein